MCPIGIVTRNRAAYLDVTLRSLSATRLPADVDVTVFDDASTDRRARTYLYSDKRIPFAHQWPANATWRTLGLSAVRNDPRARGLLGRVRVVQLEPSGVVAASCTAIRLLFARRPEAPGVLLLQDDILLKDDWYDRMVGTATTHDFGQPLGVLAGIKLNRTYARPLPPVAPSGITAQCLYVSREAFDRLDMFKVPQTAKSRFDDTLRKRVVANGLWAGVLLPFVCQHFGVHSLVRPGRSWHSRSRGRIGIHVSPPYAMASEIRQFPGGSE